MARGVGLGGSYVEGAYADDLIDGKSGGTFNSVNLTGALTALLNAGNGYATTDAVGNAFAFDNTSGLLSITAVPEPREVALGIVSLPELAGCARRRRMAA